MARNNECIEERKDSLRVHIPYYDESGKRKFISKSFKIKNYGTKQKTLEVAKKYRDEMKVKIANNMIIKEKNETLDDVYQIYKESMQLSLETMRKYDSLYRVHILSCIDKNKKFKDITFKDIQKSLNKMTTELDQNGIGKAFTLWKRLYKFAIFSDIVMKDETMKVTVPKSEKVIIKKDMTTTKEDVEEMIEKIPYYIKNERKAYLYIKAVMIIAYTGIRPAECFALEKSSIDFDNRKIIIRSKIGSSSKERWTITKPKTKESYRDVIMPEILVLPLTDLINNTETDYLFIKDDGKFINGSEFSDSMNRISKGKFRAYTMRHQFITDLITSGTDLSTVQYLAGHKNPNMTLAYARSSEEKQFQAVQNRVFASRKK